MRHIDAGRPPIRCPSRPDVAAVFDYCLENMGSLDDRFSMVWAACLRRAAQLAGIDR